MKNSIPVITIIIATYNSQRILLKTLQSIVDQTITRNKVEILIVDGGSSDNTLSIARSFKCRIIHNPMTEPIHAKYLGFMKARGKYVIGLDHDEVFANSKSLETRLNIFKRDKRVIAIHSSGYITPEHSSAINYYINEFGDPFSFFIYKLTKDYRFFVPIFKKRYRLAHEDINYVLVHISNKDGRIPLMEALAAGGMVDKSIMVKNYKEFINDKLLFLPNLLSHLLQIQPYIAVMKNDPLYHYSVEKFSGYMKKLEWRIRNNIYFSTTTGSAGFLKREQYEGKNKNIYKYLFIPYSFSLIFPFLDAVWLCFTRKNLAYFIHVPLCIITACMILYHYINKLSGNVPILTSYDGKSQISKKWI